MPINTLLDIGQVHEKVSAAARIYGASHASVSALYQAFWTVRESRGNPRGATTDQEQDILRAMLVMACSGLDATLKQLIRDCLDHIAMEDADVQKGLETFVERRIRGSDSAITEWTGTKFLAKLLCAPSPLVRATEAYIYELTGDSLQSPEQVLKAAQALGIRPASVEFDILVFRGIFKLRNAIIHELDVNLDAQRRPRNSRSEANLSTMADQVLTLSRNFIRQASRKLQGVDDAFHAQLAEAN